MCARDKANEGLATTSFPEVMNPIVNKKTARLIQYYRLKQKHNIESKIDAKKNQYSPDWMAVTTTFGRKCLHFTSELYSKFQKRAPSSLKSKTVAHVTVVIMLSTILAILISKQTAATAVITQRTQLWTFLYLASFAIHFGALVWMSFVSGLVLYFSLPRHVFGSVQENLFPAFFTHNSIMSYIMILSFMQTQSSIPVGSKSFVQVLVMTLTFTIELLVRLYVAQKIVSLKHIKTSMEAAAGCGQEIGRHELGDLAHCPRYLAVLRTFRMFHSFTAIGTIITVVCSVYHITYLSDKLCI